MLYFPQGQHAIASSYRKSRSRCRMACPVPADSLGATVGERSYLQLQIRATQKAVQYRFGCQVCFLTAVLGSQRTNGCLCPCGRWCVSYLLLGLRGNARCYSQLCFFLLFTAQQGQIENVLISELKKKKSNI